MRKLLLAISVLLVAAFVVVGCGKHLPTQLQSRNHGVQQNAGINPVIDCPGVGDHVWYDLNSNGAQDPGEPGIVGVTVTLSGGPQGPVTTTTNADGDYWFSCLSPGDYVITVDVPGNCVPTRSFDPIAGPDLDSNGSPAAVTMDVNSIYNIDFGFVCPTPPGPECKPCEGKVSELTLKYNGTLANAQVKVVMKKPKTTVFDGIVQPGGVFSFVGRDKKGTFGTDIIVSVNNVVNTGIHTSCSQPIGPGLVRGDFEVVSGRSLLGGVLCPLPPPPPTGDDFCETYGRPKALTFEYTAAGCGATHHSQAAGKVICTDHGGALPQNARIVVTNSMTPGASSALVYFNGPVSAGGSFTMDAANAGQTRLATNSWAYIYDGTALVETVQFHTSCSQPLIRGDEYGSLKLLGFTPSLATTGKVADPR
jgi:hypothetical protein